MNNTSNNVAIYRFNINNPTTDYNLNWNNLNSSTYNNCGMLVNNKTLYIACNTGNLIRSIPLSNIICSNNTFVSSSTYHHIALSISGTIHTLYVDNSAVAANTINVFNYYPSTISKLFIGSAADLSYGFNGYIDDFKVYNTALIASDISSIYYLN